MASTGNVESNPVNANRSRKRVEAETTSVTLKRPKNSSSSEGCNESADVAHDCGLDAKIKMNLETMCVETRSELVAKRLAERRKSKKERDPKKRPLTPFFLFLEDFRESFNKANPDNNKVSVVGREGGEKWRAMSEEEKKPYTERAAKQQEAHLEYWRIQLDQSMAMRKKRQELIEAEEEAEMELMMDEEWFFFHYKG